MPALRDVLSLDYLMRKLPLVIGTLLVVASSYYEVFTVYSDALKATFNLTQPEVEWLGTAKIAAGISTIIAGAVHDNKGPMVSLLVGLVTWSAGAILLCWSAIMVTVITMPTAVLVVGILLWAHGRTYAFITGLVTLVHTVSPRYRPAASAFVELAMNTGSLLYVLIYESFFINGHVLDAENQNLLGFFEMQFLIAIVVQTLSMLGLRDYSIIADPPPYVESFRRSMSESQLKANNRTEHNSSSIIESNSTEKSLIVSSSNCSYYGSYNSEICTSPVKHGCLNTHTNDAADGNCKINSSHRSTASNADEPQSLWRVMFGIEFLLFLVTMAISSAETEFFSVHISVMTASLGFSLHDTALITIYRSVIVAGLIFGMMVMIVSKKRYLALLLLQIGNVLSLSAYFCMAFDMTQVWTLYYSSVAHGVSFGLFMSVFPGIVEDFSSRYLGTLFGVVATSVVALLIIIQPTFGALYSAQIPDDSGSNYCYGPDCLKVTIWIFVSLGVLSNAVCLTLAICRHRR